MFENIVIHLNCKKLKSIENERSFQSSDQNWDCNTKVEKMQKNGWERGSGGVSVIKARFKGLPC